MKPELVVAHFNRLKLTTTIDSKTIQSEISRIKIHPDWDAKSIKYDADIAILTIKDAIEFGDYIQPVCLPRQSDKEMIVEGFVAGWGRTSNSVNNTEEHSELLMELKISSFSAGYCYSNFPRLAKAASHRTFCAGFVKEKKAACTGDSGGGFYIHSSDNSPFVVQGIVSAGVKKTDDQCRIDIPSLYTNVPMFVDWINDNMK